MLAFPVPRSLNAPFKEVAMPTGTFTVIWFYKEHCQDVETDFGLAIKWKALGAVGEGKSSDLLILKSLHCWKT